MTVRSRRWSILAWAGALGMALASSAWAQVTVTVDGDTALAEISLTDNGGTTYEAEVTIVFDTPQNLSPETLNLTAELVDPSDPTLGGRLPAGVSVIPSFPVLISVNPPAIPWLFASGFDGGGATGYLGFLNTYHFEVHTHDLAYTDDSRYRLFKAPFGVDTPFADITSELAQGSMRARGRGPAFSQFMVVDDERNLCAVSNLKLVDLDVKILAAVIGDLLRLDLLRLLGKIQVLIFVNVEAAIAVLDNLIGEVEGDAGTEIPNVWTALRDVTNDAGEILTAAQTLRFSMLRQPPLCLLKH